MTRLRAFIVHFCASAAVIAVFAALLLLLWYPDPYIHVEGALKLLGIVFGVDVVLGPLLTLILFKPGKRGLKFDMSMILAMQFLALGWGMWTAYHERPAYMVFNVDRFTVIAQRQVDYANLSDTVARHGAGSGPVVVFAEKPADPKDVNRMWKDYVESGKDLPSYSEFYRPYAAHLPEVLAASMDPESSPYISDDGRAAARDYVAEHGGKLGDYAFFPVEGRKDSALAVVRRSDGELLTIIGVAPWL